MKMNMKIKREDWIKGGNAPLIGWMTEKERDVKFSISSALLCPYLCYFLHCLQLPKCLCLISLPPTHPPLFIFSFFIPLILYFISPDQPEGLQGEADLEVDKIIAELTAGILSPATSAPTGKIVGQTTPAQVSWCMLL